jgi:cytochrome b561
VAQALQGYGRTARLLHWATVLLLTVQYSIGWLMPDIRRGMKPGEAMNLHMSFGLLILFVALLRSLWRVTHPVAPEGSLPAWQRVSAEAVHWLLYALVLATTLTGWAFASMRGWTITAFGALAIPRIAAEGSSLGRSIGALHGTFIWVLLGIAGIHVSAALIHLFIYRDRVMLRMLSGV